MLITIAAGSTWWLVGQQRQDCAGLQHEANTDFKAGRHRAAYERLKPRADACVQQRDAVASIKYAAAYSTAAYASGEKAVAKRYAVQALGRWDRLTEAEGSTLQLEGIHLADIKLGLYIPPQPPDDTPESPDERMPL